MPVQARSRLSPYELVFFKNLKRDGLRTSLFIAAWKWQCKHCRFSRLGNRSFSKRLKAAKIKLTLRLGHARASTVASLALRVSLFTRVRISSNVFVLQQILRLGNVGKLVCRRCARLTAFSTPVLGLGHVQAFGWAYFLEMTSTVNLLKASLPPSRISSAARKVVSFFLNGSRTGVNLFLSSPSTSSSLNLRW